MAARSRAAAEPGARIAALGTAARGRRAGTWTWMGTGTGAGGGGHGRRPGRAPAEAFLFPAAGGGAGRVGVGPGTLTPSAPPALHPRGRAPIPQPRAGRQLPISRGWRPSPGSARSRPGSLGPSVSGRVRTSEPTRVTHAPRDPVSPAGLPWGRRPLWTLADRDPTHLQPPQACGAQPFPSGPVRTFSGWGRQRQTGLPFAPLFPSALSPNTPRPPTPAPTYLRLGLPRRGTGAGRAEARAEVRGRPGCLSGDPGPGRSSALKPSLCPRTIALSISGVLLASGSPSSPPRKGLSAGPNFLFIHQQVFH